MLTSLNGVPREPSKFVKWAFTLWILAFTVLCFWIEVRLMMWAIGRTWPDSTPAFCPVAVAWGLVILLVRTNRQKK